MWAGTAAAVAAGFQSVRSQNKRTARAFGPSRPAACVCELMKLSAILNPAAFKSGQIHSEGKIVFDADAAQNIPDYIKIVND